MKKRCLLIFTLFFIFIQHSAWCWNYAYHLIIAQIAVDQLNETEKNKLQIALSQSHYFPEHNNYLHAAVFPDEIKKTSNRWNQWHYINLPYSADGTKTKSVKYPNIVSVLKKIVSELKDPNLPADEKAMFLSLLIHLTGDIHQPLHCINRFSVDFPNGDKGGNLFLLPIYKTHNLHALWDDGLELRQTFYTDGRLSFEKIREIALILEQRYPKSQFEAELKRRSPSSWARESYFIARDFSYHTAFNVHPTPQYIEQGQVIVAKRLVLAGYRLSETLKKVLD